VPSVSLMLAMLVPATLVTGCTATGGAPVAATTFASSTRGASPSSLAATGSGSARTSSPAVSTASYPPPDAGGGGDLLWTQRASRPLGQPVAVGDAVVVYALDGAALSVEAVDAATGRIRWQHRAATGAAAAGVNLDPAVLDGRVVYLSPVDGSMLRTSVVVVDAQTGQNVAVSDTVYEVTSRPRACQRMVCFSAYSGSQQ